MSAPRLCEMCSGPLDQIGVLWEMGVRVAVEHGCNGDTRLCATLCPVPTPDIEMIPTPCPAPEHPRDWTKPTDDPDGAT